MGPKEGRGFGGRARGFDPALPCLLVFEQVTPCLSLSFLICKEELGPDLFMGHGEEIGSCMCRAWEPGTWLMEERREGRGKAGDGGARPR